MDLKKIYDNNYCKINKNLDMNAYLIDITFHYKYVFFTKEF